MRCTRRPLLLAMLLLVAVRGDVLTQAPSTNITGTYGCAGTNPNGTPYAGRVGLVQHGETWDLRWELNGGQTALGIGLLRQNVLAVIFQTSDGFIGLAVYTVEPATETAPMRLVGHWLDPDGGGTYTETLTQMTTTEPRVPVPGERPL